MTVPKNLEKFFDKYNKIALAFSGGVDSVYLLYAAKQCGADIRAYYVNSQFQAKFELEDAKKIADQVNAKLAIIELDVMSNSEVIVNPVNRCYFCKQAIFSTIIKRAKADGYSLIIDGTNASDDADDRPGMRALKEMQVRSPLRECNITKQQIREFSKQAGLFTWNKPAYACLATRIESGVAIDEQTLEKIEKCEDFMRNFGFADFRVRVVGECAKIQLPESQFKYILENRQIVYNTLNKYFKDVVLDLKSR